MDGLAKRITTVLDRSQSIKKQAEPTEIITANQRLQQLKKVHKMCVCVCVCFVCVCVCVCMCFTFIQIHTYYQLKTNKFNGDVFIQN